jgi:hypothetical protein
MQVPKLKKSFCRGVGAAVSEKLIDYAVDELTKITGDIYNFKEKLHL